MKLVYGNYSGKNQTFYPLPLMKFWNKCGKGFFFFVTQVTLLIPAATAARVERAHLSLQFVKNDLCSTMTADCLIDLMLLFIYKNIVLDYEAIINDFANKYPRKKLLVNPLE